ncbi:DUF1430 domain-containing protein [Bacillus mycoides]|uniref:DUF1430 domain-containing protein n=1 Tax=Bacillus mycoides TaxID=1405 RepID=UPI001C023CE8|nr:DUF1430 domain-containing protein [Bacillus mycoides]QWI52479.1 DUF1430 domain-containing protein [Bacillus mycoides]
MKKVILIIISLGFLICSSLSVFLFDLKESYEQIYFPGENVSTFEVTSWKKDKKNIDILNELDQFAKDNKINVYKKQYSTSNKGGVNYDYYYSIYVPSKVRDVIPINNSNINNKGVFSTNSGDIELFNKSSNMVLQPLLKAEEKSVIGFYSFQYKNSSQYKLITDKLSSLGLVYNSYNSLDFKYVISTFFAMPGIFILMLSVIIFIVMLFFVTLYEIFMRYKELAILKLYGYRKRTIYFQMLFEKMKLILYIMFPILGIFFTFVWVKYEGNRFLEFVLFSILIFLIYILITMLISSLVFFVIRFVTIQKMIKNKQPFRFVNVLNITAKYIASFVMVFLIFNIVDKQKDLNMKIDRVKDWDKVKSYVFFEYGGKASDSANDRQLHYQNAKNIVDLYKEVEERSIVVAPSDYFMPGAPDINYSENISNKYIVINSNYLKMHPVFDINNKSLEGLKPKSDTELTLLVPEKYRSMEKEIRSHFLKYFRLQKYFDKVFIKEMTKDEMNLQNITIDFHYIKNNQSNFLYDHTNSFKNESVIDSILVLIDSNTFGPESYTSFLGNGRIFTKVVDINNSYKELLPVISDTKTEELIMGTPGVYGSVSKKINDLKQESLMLKFTLLFVSITLLSIIFITVLNYLERNKYILAVKTIHGYSFINKHYKFIYVSLGSWFITLVSSVVLFGFSLFVISSNLALICLELLLINFIVRILEYKEIVSVVKGE